MLDTKHLQTTILDSISDAFFAVDSGWRFTYVNPAAVPLLRHYSDTLLGRTIWEVFPGAIGTEFETHYRRALWDTVAVVFEAFYAPFDAWFTVRAYPTLDGGLAVYFQDVTDRKRAEFDRQRLAAIVTSSQDAIIGLTLDGAVTDWNASAERLYGYTAKEMVGRSMSLLFAPADQAQLPTTLERLKTGEPIAQLEWSVLTKDGRQVEVALSVSPLRDESGQVVGAATIARDLTGTQERGGTTASARGSARGQRQRNAHHRRARKYSLDQPSLHAADRLYLRRGPWAEPPSAEEWTARPSVLRASVADDPEWRSVPRANGQSP